MSYRTIGKQLIERATFGAIVWKWKKLKMGFSTGKLPVSYRLWLHEKSHLVETTKLQISSTI